MTVGVWFLAPIIVLDISCAAVEVSSLESVVAAEVSVHIAELLTAIKIPIAVKRFAMHTMKTTTMMEIAMPATKMPVMEIVPATMESMVSTLEVAVSTTETMVPTMKIPVTTTKMSSATMMSATTKAAASATSVTTTSTATCFCIAQC